MEVKTVAGLRAEEVIEAEATTEALQIRQGQQGDSRNCANSFITEVNKTEVDKIDKGKVESDKNEINWILDSGCTDHIVNDDKLFDEYVVLEKPVDVKLGDGRIVTATKIGRINTSFQIYNRDCQVTLYNVFYVKEMKRNLISYAKVTVKNKIISYGNTSKIYNQNNELIAIARKENDMYHMTSFVTDTIQNKEVNINQVTSNNKMTLKEKWHRKLGHVNFNYLNILCKTNYCKKCQKN